MATQAAGFVLGGNEGHRAGRDRRSPALGRLLSRPVGDVGASAPSPVPVQMTALRRTHRPEPRAVSLQRLGRQRPRILDRASEPPRILPGEGG